MRSLFPAAMAALLLLLGCARAPVGEEPVRPAELADLAEALKGAAPSADSYRATGTGEIRASGRTLNVAFAMMYERPGWLRADLRPALGTMGANLTALALLEGDCARLYFPARLIEVTGCLSDVLAPPDWLDAASFLIGLPDAAFFEDLTEVTRSRRRGTVSLTGLAHGRRVRVEIDESGPFITMIELTELESGESVRAQYEGHGWKPGLFVPRTVSFVALEGTSRELEVRLHYETFRAGGTVDRSRYALEIPPGVLEIDWRELSIWR